MRRIALAAALLAATAPLCAQRVHDVPARPRLTVSADTNNANAYFVHAVQNLERDPRDAAAAFYWAEQLRPGWGEALYGRRVALLMSDRRRLLRYMDADRSVMRSAEVQAIDSLQLRAYMAEPFMTPSFDRHLFTAYVHAVFNEGTTNTALAAHQANTWLLDAPPFLKAWFAYAQGRYGEAITEYERALRRADRQAKPRMRTDVARIRFFAGNLDSALVGFGTALTEFRARDARDVVFVYESKALLEHSIGAIHERRGDVNAAREAYGRALQEDLAYYPAHLRLAMLARAARDTATLVSEMALAVELAPQEAALRYHYGSTLAEVGRVAEGAAQFQQAIEMNPYFALPHYAMGVLHMDAGMPEDAARHFENFLARAAADDPMRANATRGLAGARAQLGQS